MMGLQRIIDLENNRGISILFPNTRISLKVSAQLQSELIIYKICYEGFPVFNCDTLVIYVGEKYDTDELSSVSLFPAARSARYTHV